MNLLKRFRLWRLGRIKEIVSTSDVSHGTAKRMRIRAICPQQEAVRLARRIKRLLPDHDLIFLFCYNDQSAYADGVIHTRIRIGKPAHRSANGLWAKSTFIEDDVIEIAFEEGG
jgi:hypothetical protein